MGARTTGANQQRAGRILNGHQSDKGFRERLNTAAEAKRAALERFRARAASDDPAVLCAMVRSLAIHAHRAMQQRSAVTPTGMPRGIGELREHIGRFQQHLDRFRRQHKLGLEDLQRWLDSLRRCVDGLMTHPFREREE